MSGTLIIQNKEILIVAGIALIVILFLLVKGGKRPPTKTFICARCKKEEIYSTRSIEAWRKGFQKIYCQNCHILWLRNNPNHQKQHYSSRSSGSGCLGMLVVLIIIPPIVYGVISYVS
ncbi:hypothetical protein [Aurantivibrio infirmus]